MNMPPQSRFDGEKAREFWEKEASRFEDHWPLIANLLRDRGHNAWLAHECDRLTAENKALIAAASENSAQLDLAKLHKALEPFAMAALTSRDEWHKQDGAMAELGVPDDADAWMPDGITQGQLNAVEAFYEQIEKVLNAANR